ncbi:response regulator [Pseudomonas syringae]|uniref:Response regulator n=1 Tax=Pseudomonas syringae pv. papulans TaxID=83963 RepID=A0AA43IS07_PSESX|nr:response regulator [Pseudomonas syringae]KWS41804.1 response regulator receiver protein [Pseudomonas syringae pv. papulans]MDH4603486.1 response regulator [Pseudomonas syringae pv. papulans]MDH4620747.1 response regulator [Pseudomonas syringae pv. papulans]
MTILIVEDDENKRIQLSQFLQAVIPNEDVQLQRSLQSGVKKIRQQTFDFIILDMTLPQYDLSPDEPSDDTHIFGGQEFLAQMERFDVRTPVVVFTQFEVFGKPPNEMNLESLDLKLKAEYPGVYKGVVYYHSSINSWKQQLKDKFIEHGFSCKGEM